MEGLTTVLVLLGGLLFGGGGIATVLTWRTQSRSVPRRDAVEERRLDLEQSDHVASAALAQAEHARAQTESTNKILAAALDFYKDECAELRIRIAECESRHHD